MTSSPPPNQVRRLVIALSLNALIIIGEFAAGLWIHSVGLMTDAWHNLIDQGSLFLTLYAHLLCLRPPTESRAFSNEHISALAGFVNAVLLIGVAVTMTAVAITRLRSPRAVAGGWVMVTCLFTFAANLGIALLLRRGAKDDLNLRGAFWHMLGDAWASFGVAAGGFVIWLKGGWYIVDPLMSLLIVAVILKGSFSLVRDCVRALMKTAPRTV